MFIGSINRYMRCVLESAASQWRGQDIYVACSGNFTVERILSRCGVGRIFSNDVSIYSCALGWHLENAVENQGQTPISRTKSVSVPDSLPLGMDCPALDNGAGRSYACDESAETL
jgi:hypothetical protein